MAHSEAGKKWRREWAKNNRDKLRNNLRKWRSENLGKHLVTGARNRAKRNGLPFNLPPDYFETLPSACTYCAVELKMQHGPRKNCSPSIDRVDPNMGYVVGNVVISCWKCNRWKQNMSPSDLRKLANAVTEVERKLRG